MKEFDNDVFWESRRDGWRMQIFFFFTHVALWRWTYGISLDLHVRSTTLGKLDFYLDLVLPEMWRGGGGASNVAPRFNRCFSHPHPGGAQVLKLRISSVKAGRTLSPKQEIYSATLQTCDAATLEYAYQIPSYHLAANTGQRGYVLVNLALGLHGADTTLGKKKIYIWTVLYLLRKPGHFAWYPKSCRFST